MRYVDAEIAKEVLKEALADFETAPTVEDIEQIIDCIPTADVVPKSKLTKELALIEQFEKTIDNGVETCNGCHAKYTERIRIAKEEVVGDFARFLIDKSRGGEIFISDIPGLVIEYTEGKDK